jgi:hypothetical protein
MKTLFNNSELKLVLQNIKGNEVVSLENQIGLRVGNSGVYYWFKESKSGLMESDYYWSQSNGKKSYTFSRFYNIMLKLNLI